MQFEQPAELNKYVDATIPLTWEIRRRFWKLLLPLLVITSLFCAEQQVIRQWLNDQRLVEGLPALSAIILLLSIVYAGAIEVYLRIFHQCKRTIDLRTKRVMISPRNHRVAWANVIYWRLEPILNAPELTKLTLKYTRNKWDKRPRECSIALRQTDQIPEFLGELDSLRRTIGKVGEIVRFATPALPDELKPPPRGFIRSVISMYLFLHGGPLLFAGIFGPGPQREGAPRFSPTELAKIQRVATAHFASVEQFRNFLLLVGGILMALAAGFYFWGFSASGYFKKQRERN